MPKFELTPLTAAIEDFLIQETPIQTSKIPAFLNETFTQLNKSNPDNLIGIQHALCSTLQDARKKAQQNTDAALKYLLLWNYIFPTLTKRAWRNKFFHEENALLESESALHKEFTIANKDLILEALQTTAQCHVFVSSRTYLAAFLRTKSKDKQKEYLKKWLANDDRALIKTARKDLDSFLSPYKLQLLPGEILLHIIRYLDMNDIARLSMVCVATAHLIANNRSYVWGNALLDISREKAKKLLIQNPAMRYTVAPFQEGKIRKQYSPLLDHAFPPAIEMVSHHRKLRQVFSLENGLLLASNEHNQFFVIRHVHLPGAVAPQVTPIERPPGNWANMSSIMPLSSRSVLVYAPRMKNCYLLDVITRQFTLLLHQIDAVEGAQKIDEDTLLLWGESRAEIRRISDNAQTMLVFHQSNINGALIAGNKIITYSKDNTTAVYDMQGNKRYTFGRLDLRATDYGITNAQLLSNGHLLTSSSLREGLNIWDLSTGKSVAQVKDKVKPGQLALLPDDSVVYMTYDAKIVKYDTRQKKREVLIPHIDYHRFVILNYCTIMFYRRVGRLLNFLQGFSFDLNTKKCNELFLHDIGSAELSNIFLGGGGNLHCIVSSSDLENDMRSSILSARFPELPWTQPEDIPRARRARLGL